VAVLGDRLELDAVASVIECLLKLACGQCLEYPGFDVLVVGGTY